MSESFPTGSIWRSRSARHNVGYKVKVLRVTERKVQVKQIGAFGNGQKKVSIPRELFELGWKRVS